MPRKGENIYKRKDGRWEGRYIGCYDENHKAKYVYIYGKTYTEVKQKLAIERGRQKQHVPAEKKQITYGEVLDLWLHSTKTSIKESTYLCCTEPSCWNHKRWKKKHKPDAPDSRNDGRLRGY